MANIYTPSPIMVWQSMVKVYAKIDLMEMLVIEP
jgi:hypothetical protein